jgi:hypothetical protein
MELLDMRGYIPKLLTRQRMLADSAEDFTKKLFQRIERVKVGKICPA